MTVEDDELEGLAQEIRRVIESNKAFLEGVDDEELDAEQAEETSEDDEDLDLEEL